MQDIAWMISIVLMLFIIAAFLFVVAKSGQRLEYAEIQKHFYQIRGTLFWLLVIAIAGVTLGTVKGLPYAAQRSSVDTADSQVINAEAFQWYWKLSENKIKVNKKVIFNISSADVNHGFGLYNDALELLAQVQAMPGYVNKLEYVFTRPGTYRILCMEYCGIAHHAMVSALQVTE